eukprot:TRINITY_DN710_c0_g3_i1.p1 TRINITY_DN710_c0_g3~~TRINITY_DN710_c0_g3_i1.p1  ORF type:complete len:297 (+),score=38.24 TRINITY_DN710_c0_g3_i1:100-891(+)
MAAAAPLNPSATLVANEAASARELEAAYVPSDEPAPSLPASVPSGSFVLPDNSGIGALRVVGTLLPIIYVWSLPFLAQVGFAHKCPTYPACDAEGASISNFIANAHATGAMAACYYYPAIQMWLNAQYVRHYPYVYETLGIFQICFGMFLMCPVTEVPNLHFSSVLAFCISALFHCKTLTRQCAGARLRLCRLLLIIAVGSFASLFVLAMITGFSGDWVPNNVPMLFWCLECCGLTSITLFTLFWYRAQRSGPVSHSIQSAVV